MNRILQFDWLALIPQECQKLLLPKCFQKKKTLWTKFLFPTTIAKLTSVNTVNNLHPRKWHLKVKKIWLNGNLVKLAKEVLVNTVKYANNMFIHCWVGVLVLCLSVCLFQWLIWKPWFKNKDFYGNCLLLALTLISIVTMAICYASILVKPFSMGLLFSLHQSYHGNLCNSPGIFHLNMRTNTLDLTA